MWRSWQIQDEKSESNSEHTVNQCVKSSWSQRFGTYLVDLQGYFVTELMLGPLASCERFRPASHLAGGRGHPIDCLSAS